MPARLHTPDTDQVDLLLTRCGYDKYVMDDDGGKSFVYRNRASRRQIIVGFMSDDGEPEYTLINPGRMPKAIIEPYINDDEQRVKHTDAALIINLFLDLTVAATTVNVDPKYTADSLDLFRWHPYQARNQQDGYTEMLRFVAESNISYKDAEKLILTGMSLAEIRPYARLNSALVSDLLNII